MLGNETGLLVKFSRQLIVKLDKLLVKKKKWKIRKICQRIMKNWNCFLKKFFMNSYFVCNMEFFFFKSFVIYLRDRLSIIKFLLGYKKFLKPIVGTEAWNCHSEEYVWCHDAHKFYRYDRYFIIIIIIFYYHCFLSLFSLSFQWLL